MWHTEQIKAPFSFFMKKTYVLGIILMLAGWIIALSDHAFHERIGLGEENHVGHIILGVFLVILGIFLVKKSN